MPMKLERVLIVGAGMAGLTLAISLRRQGLNPDIVERQPEWPVHGAGIYLVGNAMRALDSLGLAGEVLQSGSVIKTQTLLDARGRQQAVIDTGSVWATCGPCVGIRRASLQSILVKASGDAGVRFGTSVTALAQQQDGAAVKFSDGSERVYDLVVGADGLRSSIRTHLFGNVPPRFCGQVGWRFLVSCPASITGWTLFAGHRGVFLFIPVGGGQAYCYADAAVEQPFEDPLEGRLERLRSRFASCASPAPEALAQMQSTQEVASRERSSGHLSPTVAADHDVGAASAMRRRPGTPAPVATSAACLGRGQRASFCRGCRPGCARICPITRRGTMAAMAFSPLHGPPIDGRSPSRQPVTDRTGVRDYLPCAAFRQLFGRPT